MSDYSDPDDYHFYDYGDWWNPFDSPDDYDDYLFYDGYDDSYDDCDYDDMSESNSKDEELAAYMEHLTTNLRNLQTQRVFCDVTLKVGDKSFQAHRNILAASSDYFMAMFTSGFQEADRTEISIEGDSSIFENLLEFAYTGVIKDLTPDTVADVMSMGGYLQFTHALTACKTFVCKKYALGEKEVSLQKAYEICLIAESYGLQLEELVKKSKTYMMEKMIYLTKNDDFAEDTSFECLDYCLDIFNERQKPTSGCGDKDMLKIIISWLKHKQDERKHYAYNLMKKLRLGLIPTEVLETLRKGAELKDLPECLMLLDKVLGLKLTKTPEWITDVPLRISYPDLFAHRDTTVSLVSLGGIKSQNRAIKLKNSYVSWGSCDKEIPPLPEKISCHGCVVVNGHLFISGGMTHVGQQHQHHHHRRGNKKGAKETTEVKGKVNAKTYWLDAKNKKWEPLPYMRRARRNHALVHMDDCIYAIGGTGKDDFPTNNVECFSLNARKWYGLTKMPFSIMEPSAVVYKDKLLVYGKRDRNDTYALLMYSPGKPENAVSCVPEPGKWYLLRTEKHTGNCRGVYKPVLTVQEDKCYRVVYEMEVKDDSKKGAGDSNNNGKRKARVHEIVCDIDSQVPSASVGEEEAQNEDLMKHVIGTVNFCIADRLYVNACGLVYRTELTVGDSNKKKVDYDFVWINLGRDNDMAGAAMVLHTYEE